MEGVVKEFLLESYENLDRLDRDFVDLEKNPSKETFGSIFRVIHTIKGTCGFLSFSKLQSVTHAGEGLLALLRAGRMQLNPQITDSLLAMVQAVRELLADIEHTGKEGSRDYSSLIDTLSNLQKGDPSLDLQPAPVPLGEILVAQGRVRSEDLDRALKLQASGDQRRVGEILVAQGVVTEAEILEALQAQRELKKAALDSSVRVDLGLLDELVNLVGELVLCRNRILRFAMTQEDPDFLLVSQQLNLVIGELQEGVMKTRLQPIGGVWNKFPRFVREVAASCGKQVRIEMAGEGTKLDRTVIEAIRDPITHIERNSVDHGIESPEVRLAAGKSAEGRLVMRAYHEGGQVNIEIIDDGAGIDLEKVRVKALQRGLLTQDQAARMSETELVNLIFLPGFSTTDKVTTLSGRGVGMEVVKTSIEKIGGIAEIQSRRGQGTTVRIRIPLTLAIIPALLVTSGGDRYAIPQASVLEIVRLEGDQRRSRMEWLHDAPACRLRGELLPLIYLNHEFKVEEKVQRTDNQSINLLVLRADKRKFGLVVDAIEDTDEIVAKPLGRHLKGIGVFSGATIMSDGKVALILDVLGISRKAGEADVMPESGQKPLPSVSEEPPDVRDGLLIVRHGKEKRVGITLSQVARVEEFARSLIENSSLRQVVQYRGSIMPLIRLGQVLGEDSHVPDEGKANIQAVVYCNRGRSVGLVVDQVIDIVEAPVTISRNDQIHGISGSAIVQGRVIDLVDARAVIEAVEPGFFDQSEAA